MSNEDRNLQVKDVYDCASDLFQEFEKIITITGIDDASVLITKVKNVLELLEESVKKIEYLDKEYTDLKARCAHLSFEKLLKEEENKNLKQTFEELEESWMQESTNLKSLINKLTAENKILEHNLALNKDMPPEVDNAYKAIIEEQENLISKLKSNLKQKDSNRAKDQANIEVLTTEINRLTKLNSSLHLRYQEARRIIAEIREDKREFEERISFQSEKLHNLEEKFGDLKETVTETCEFNFQNMIDICKPLHDINSANVEKLEILHEENEQLKQEVRDLKLELVVIKSQIKEYEKRLSDVTLRQNIECVERHGRINQIYRLFLGVAGVSSSTCLFGNKPIHPT